MKIVIAMVGGGVAALLAFVLIGLPLYVYPAHDEPRDVDAVFVIGPPSDQRMEIAESMLEAGQADALVVSIEDGPGLPEWMDAAIAACTEPRDYPVYCAQPDPFSTRGEARWIARLADENDWESIAIITVGHHMSRTRVIMERCLNGDQVYLVAPAPMTPRYMAYQYVYQTAAFVKVAFERGC